MNTWTQILISVLLRARGTVSYTCAIQTCTHYFTSISTVPRVSFLHFSPVWKSNSYMHNIEGGSASACLHFFCIIIINSFGTWWPFVLTANTQFCHRWAMHCESWTCAYLCDVISDVDLYSWMYGRFFLCVTRWAKNRTVETALQQQRELSLSWWKIE